METPVLGPSRHTQPGSGVDTVGANDSKSGYSTVDPGNPPRSQQVHRVERRWLSHRRTNGLAKELGAPRKRDRHDEERFWTYSRRTNLHSPSQGRTSVGEPSWTHHHVNPPTQYSGGGDGRCTRGPSGSTCEGEGRHHSNNRVTVQEAPNLEDRSLLHRQGSRAQQGGRVLRNRRYRRPFDDHRHTKRLFTPEIKKFLKDWLVRRRDHPYPNRDEKKRLAVQTGLTYIQICNWFANWRRKLKNAGDEQRTTWGHLIKSYNTQAQGNVEQFSICSDDSIWEQQALNEPVTGDEDQDVPTLTYATNTTAMDHSYSAVQNKSGEPAAQDVTQETISSSENQPQCFQVTSTTTEEEDAHATPQTVAPASGGSENQAVAPCGSSKYKSHIMEKYLRDLSLGPSQSDDANALYKKEDAPKKWTRLSKESDYGNVNSERGRESAPNSSTPTVGESDRSTRPEKKRRSMKKTKETCPPMVLSKWLESAAKFQPTKSYVPWTVSKKDAWRPPRGRNTTKKTQRQNETVDGDPALPNMADVSWASQGHHREELDAAEALTRLAGLQH